MVRTKRATTPTLDWAMFAPQSVVVTKTMVAGEGIAATLGRGHLAPLAMNTAQQTPQSTPIAIAQRTVTALAPAHAQLATHVV